MDRKELLQERLMRIQAQGQLLQIQHDQTFQELKSIEDQEKKLSEDKE